ncbi:hypothetical protein JTE90_005558 [Oedothorax gibbosus]|uniref:Ribosomal protein L27 n=1 Tax=Oedothorax gibbosus TaxID=931172 RepID=A0AAV6V921_9ARAC|nr:hypothetical protein JTE90_005558 [Oedothorax gibbosus]
MSARNCSVHNSPKAEPGKRWVISFVKGAHVMLKGGNQGQLFTTRRNGHGKPFTKDGIPLIVEMIQVTR